jgi:hypothetical protein
MDTALQEELDKAVAALTGAAPGHWIRIAMLAGRLLDDDGTTAGFKEVTVAVTYDGDQLGQRYVTPPLGKGFNPLTLDAACAGRPEEGWTILWLVVDRDGERRVDFSHEEARPLDDSATDEYWQAAHQYVERNRAELEPLVDRLRAGGQLPGSDDVTAVDPLSLPPSERPGASAPEGKDSGLLGRMFGRR